MPQPFDKGPFREIRIPGWVQETVGVGYTLSGMSTAQREAAAAAGVTISEMGFVDPYYPYYDSKLLHKRSPHVPLERIHKEVAEYKRLKIRILGVYPPCLQGEVYETHPDWRRIGTNTTEIPQIDMVKYGHGGMLCLLGPYGDFFIDVLAEILTQFPDVDAFSFDGLHYAGVCYCQHCRENYKKDTGQAIPNVDMADAAYRRYQHWADRRMEDLVRRMQTRLKGIKPEVALVTWTTNAGRFGHFLSIPRNMPARMNLLLDAPDQEFWLDESNRGATIIPAFANAYIWAVTNHRVAFSEPYLMSHGNPYGKDSFPGHEVERRMMLALTYGAASSIAVGQPEHLQPTIYRCLGEVRRRKPWLTHKRPERWAALVVSDNTRNFYGRAAHLVEDRYMANVFGVFRAAVEEHLPLAVINDWDLNDEDLAGYKLLILANTACLGEDQVAAVRRFVAGGGGLIASLDVSLFDESGNPREAFALGDVLGVRYRGQARTGAPPQAEVDVNFAKSLGPEYWEKRTGIFDLTVRASSPVDSPRLRGFIGNAPVTFKGRAVKVAPSGAGAVGEGTLAPKPGVQGDTTPAIVTHAFGKGKVVYLAAGLDAAYYLYAYPYQRVLLRQAMTWASPAAPPLRVEAPMCVHVTLMRQEREGKRLVVHLFNDVNTTAFHALPNDDVPLREETIPIRDIKLTLAKAYRIARIHQEPEGVVLTARATEQGTQVVVPRLDVHTMVVAELAE
ncbi:MAG: hypothetical protein JXQ73_01890 [Phycisphaerae bacterium]|nr:hypothetical protein [Phycisphaerae bacterium]